jgi:hypothetical protein
VGAGGYIHTMLQVGVLCAQVLFGAAAGDARVLVLDLRPIEVSAGEVKVLDGLLAAAVGAALGRVQGPVLATTDDLRTLVDVEATKMEAGCDTASCLAEVGEALGAGHVVSGTVGKLGKQTVLNLTLFEVATGRSLSRVTRQARSPAELGSAMDEVTGELLAPWLGDDVRAPAQAPGDTRSEGPNTFVLGGAALLSTGVLVAVGGGVGAYVLDERLAAGSGASAAEKQQALDFGVPLLITAAAATGVAIVGGALLGVGVRE